MVTLETITVEQFQELYKIQKGTQEPEEKMTESIAVLLNKTVNEVENMPMPEFQRQTTELSKLWEYYNHIPETAAPKTIKGYGITYEPGLLSRGQWVTCMHFMKADMIENMHLILASITYDPKTGKHNGDDHKEIAEDLLKANFLQVHAACVFFSLLFKTSFEALRGFILKELLRSGMPRKIANSYLTTLLMNMDGFITSNLSPISKE